MTTPAVPVILEATTTATIAVRVPGRVTIILYLLQSIQLKIIMIEMIEMI